MQSFYNSSELLIISSDAQLIVQEIHSLEEHVKRNRAEVQSSENLAEQYREQATKAR